jgi:hypothetical protein
MLKKEFNKKDVNRARNLITGNVNSSSETQIGYTKKRIEYKEGDIWTENKKTWTIKNGIKQTISKLDSIRKEVFIPLCCPKCDKVMKHHFDKPNYRIHKMCYNCVIDFEGKLKHVPGRYEKYIKELELKNKLTSLDQVEGLLLDAINTSNEGYVSEKGEIERWIGGIDKTKWTKDIKKYAKKTRKKLETELNESEKNKTIN